LDRFTGLYNNRARWYDAGAGRFISEDPIGFAAGDANLYRYCGNSPTNATDPSGMIIETPWDIASVIVGAASVVYDVAHIAVTGEGWADLGMDLFGLGVDIAAALLPGVPGGVSMANRALRTGYKAVDVGRKIDTGINAYQAVQSGIHSYEAFRQGDILGGTLNLVGAGLGGTHFAIRTGSRISTSRLGPFRMRSGVGVDSVADSAEAISQAQRKQWGGLFDRLRGTKYEYNQVRIQKQSGKGHWILDSYNESTGEIVSRKFTQLSQIKTSSGIGYIREAGRKYSPGSMISNTAKNSEKIRGNVLRGQLFLEVPMQKLPVPQKVLEAARNARVVIRDIEGRIYRL